MSADTFKNCAKPACSADFLALELTLGSSLPEDFKRHYSIWNGGTPECDWFPSRGPWEPIWVHRFLPLSAVGEKTPEEPTIQSTYKSAADRHILSPGMLPFAVDPGGNFFCLDVASGAVSYHVNDAWDADLSIQENQSKAMRPLTSSFSKFVDALVPEDEAFA